MLKKRMLLLVAAVAAFGAVMVGQAFATVTGSSTSNNSSTSVGNYTIEGINLGVTVVNDFGVAGNVIPPTGVLKTVGHVSLANNTSYAIQVTGWSVTGYTDNGFCGVYPANGAGAGFVGPLSATPGGFPNFSYPYGIGPTSTASIAFQIKIGPDALITAACQFNGAVTINAAQII